jgi:disulfide bond formation protein DsbB
MRDSRSPIRFVARRSARVFTLIFAMCAVILAIVLYLQHVLNLDPCPWCIVQRILLIAVGLAALVGALHRPTGAGIAVYALSCGALALGGGAAAAYHIYLQGDPERAAKCAGSAVERLLDQSRLGQLLPGLFQYDGPCTLKPWSLLGLSIPEWSLVAFVLLFMIALAIPSIVRR